MSRPPVSNEMSDLPPDQLEDDELDTEDEGVSDATGELDLGLEAEATPQRLKAGVEVIQTALKTLPNAPGVYRMIDGEGAVLYVGKAKSSQKACIELRAWCGSYELYCPHDCRNGGDGICHHRDRDRSAVA